MVTVKLFGTLRKYVDGNHLLIPGENVHQVIENLCTAHPDLDPVLLADERLRPHFKITLNGHDISLSAGTDTTVADDDQLAIFSPIAGGSQ
jgi:sulfur-carrier protein